MPINLSAMTKELRTGVLLFSRQDEPLTLNQISSKYPNLRGVFAALSMKKIGDLSNFPDRIEVNGNIYERKLVFAGREYPQGWGRGPGGAAAEPEPEPDGKVDTFKYEENENMRALRLEISDFLNHYLSA